MGYLFYQKLHIKGKDLELVTPPPPYKTLLASPKRIKSDKINN